MNILGISALYHDSAACLVQDGRIVAAAQEERFTRKKHDPALPNNAILYCLREGQVPSGGIDMVVFYDKPLTKFTRLLSTYSEVAPAGMKSLLMAIPVWLKEKSLIPYHIERFLKKSGYGRPRDFLLTEHHHSHAASAFYPSQFQEAAIITVDGVGEWTSTAIGVGEGHSMRLLFEQRFPHSLGMLYSAFTYFTGFRVNSGEYKLMGLAPYGEPKYVDLIKDKLLTIREDGSFHLNLEYFGYLDDLKMTNHRFTELFGGPPRKPETDITVREMDLARSIQAVTEEIMLKMARYTRVVTGKRHLCMAGGVALNCVANGKILHEKIFDDVFIQPAAGDAGGALGAALYAWHHILGNPRTVDGVHDSMRGAMLGPSFPREQIKRFLDDNKLPYHDLPDGERNEYIAKAVAEEKVVGLFQGRMEFGPRSLCARSIIADARSTKMQSYLNIATKFRESFRPFAPIVLEEDAASFFEMGCISPYMLLCDQVLPKRCVPQTKQTRGLTLKEWVNQPRSDVPAITHVDNSARIQTIDRERNPRTHDILTRFKRMTGYGIMVNTSFNVRSEPIVCTPEDAYRCFMRTGIDVLVLDDFVLDKSAQPAWEEKSDWQKEFGLD
ncbi:MAG: carbamoyltransferase N-terminal domain-containing protein [Phycisphaerae bacterium]|nr:carbamoyltransferase N-terminal domain-containing protein [Phycisphaerae bacterium]